MFESPASPHCETLQMEQARQALLKAARDHQLRLRQNYNQAAATLLWQVAHFAQTHQFKLMRAALKKQRTLIQRIVRDIERQAATHPHIKEGLADLVERVKRLCGAHTKG